MDMDVIFIIQIKVVATSIMNFGVIYEDQVISFSNFVTTCKEDS